MRKVGRWIGASVAFLVALSLAIPTGAQPAAGQYEPDAGLIKWAKGHEGSATSAQGAARTRNFRVVGHSPLGGGGFNADVWAHGNFAYVGVWGRDPQAGIACPGTGVKVADISNPRNPRWVSVLQNPRLTSAEDVVVRSVNTPWFRGDLAVTGLQACGRERPVARGLQFFDVTNPYRPRELGRWRAPQDTIGCHEVDLTNARRDGRILAACANSFATFIKGTGPAGDEIVVVDATNPRNPRKVGGWQLNDAGIDFHGGIGEFKAKFAHSVEFVKRGTELIGSYWDAGATWLDVSNPGNPRLLGRTQLRPPDEDVDLHSLDLVNSDRWLIFNLEDWSPLSGLRRFDGWGESYLYELQGPADRTAAFLGLFATRNTHSMNTDGFYSAHNTAEWDFAVREFFSSWYSDGIRWWTANNAGVTREKGFFVPPATADPHGFFPTAPIVWGVYVHKGKNLVLASDINSGLWILDPIGL